MLRERERKDRHVAGVWATKASAPDDALGF